VPQPLEGRYAKAGINFQGTGFRSCAKKSTSWSPCAGGGILFDDDPATGWLGYLFSQMPRASMMAIKGRKSLGALYRNNHDGTFTDVLTRLASATPNASQWGGSRRGLRQLRLGPDLYGACLAGKNVAVPKQWRWDIHRRYRRKGGLLTGGGSTGAAFGDYDGDGS